MATGRNAPVTEALDYASTTSRSRADGQSLWITAEDKGVVPVFKANADGSGFTAVYRQGTSTALSVGKGVVAFLNDTTSRPNELFVLDAGDRQRAPAHARQRRAVMAKLDLGEVKEYWFKGAGGRRRPRLARPAAGVRPGQDATRWCS